MKLIEYFQENVGTKIRIGFDPQSPLGMASLIMGYENFLKALYRNTEELHLLLKIVTSTLIEAIKIQMEVTENLFASRGNRPLDPRDGICIADDLIAILSPPYTLPLARCHEKGFM